MFAAFGQQFASKFSPLSLSPALWLSDTGSDASVWPDLSGNGRDATQATGASQPSIVTNSLNGRQVRRFDGTNDSLFYAGPLFSYSGAATVFVVTGSYTAAASEYGPFIAEFNSAINGQTSISVVPNRFPNAEFRPATDVYAPGGIEHGASYTATNPHVSVFSWSNWGTHKTNGNTVIRVDGNSGSPATYGANPSDGTRNTYAIGVADSTGGTGSFIGADIAEILVFQSALSATDIQKVESYLNAKYAIY